MEQFRSLATRVREHVVRMVHYGKSSHIGSCLSVVDLLTVLYTRILKVDPSCVSASDRDRFILSKGHASAALYAILAERGFFPVSWLKTFYKNGTKLPGHVTHHNVPGVEVSTGSLGHGLSIGCGMALAAKRSGESYRVFVLQSDGECDEGSVWEAALFASHHGLENLTTIVDYNKIQSLGQVKDILDLEPFAKKWQAFGWEVREIDGHDFEQIESSLLHIPHRQGRPTCVIAHTIKGKGVSFMEDQFVWHYFSPDDKELALALAELGG